MKNSLELPSAPSKESQGVVEKVKGHKYCAMDGCGKDLTLCWEENKVPFGLASGKSKHLYYCNSHLEEVLSQE